MSADGAVECFADVMLLWAASGGYFFLPVVANILDCRSLQIGAGRFCAEPALNGHSAFRCPSLQCDLHQAQLF